MNGDNSLVIYLQLPLSLGQMPTNAQVVQGLLLLQERKVISEKRQNVYVKLLATKTAAANLLICTTLTQGRV